MLTCHVSDGVQERSVTSVQPAIETTGSRASSAHSAADRWQVNALVGVLQDLAAATELATVQALVVAAARAVADADGATFVLRDGDRCHYAEEEAISPLWKGRRFPASACISGWAMEHRSVAVVPDIEVDPRIPMAVYRPTFVRSLAMLPIRAVDPIGAIGVYWSRPHAPSEPQIAALQAIADAAAIGLERVRTAEAFAGQVTELEDANTALAAANESLTHFAAIASHDLRSPLATLAGLLSTLAARTAPRLTGTDRHLLERAQEQASRSLETVDGLLGLSDARGSALQLGTVPLDRLVEEVLEQLEPEVTAVGATVERHGLPEVTGDGRLLRVLFQNLLSNALRFRADDRPLFIRVDGRHRGGHVEFRVTDNGRGLSVEERVTLFSLFARGEHEQTAPGHGIGLATSCRIVERHGGTIRHEPRDVGASFVVELPLEPLSR